MKYEAKFVTTEPNYMSKNYKNNYSIKNNKLTTFNDN